MAHATQTQFGYPQTLIKDYDNWCLLLRPLQPTLGSLVLVYKQDVTAFSEVSQSAFSELKQVITDIETGLTAFRPYQKINYLMLMMNDPHVHYHVIPRYDASQTFEGQEFKDEGWPAVPQLGNNVSLENGLMQPLLEAIKSNWPQS